MMRLLGILFLVCCMFFSCRDEYKGVNVDSRLLPYMKRFEEESQKRGVSFQIKDAKINGKIISISTDGVLGYCNHNPNDNNLITISRDYWERATDLEREYVVFHELGHCFLGRIHDNATDSLGICKSMMAAGDSECQSNYNPVTRSRFLDELFK